MGSSVFDFGPRESFVEQDNASDPSWPRQRLLSVKDVALLLGCGTSTIWRWARNGVLPRPLRIAGVSRWKIEDVLSIVIEADQRRER